MDKWCNEPHAPGNEGEPHFISDVSGLVSHVSNATEDWQGREVIKTREGEVDLPPSRRAEGFEKWLAGAFLTSAEPSSFDYVPGERPPFV